ncbi:MAG: MHFG family PEP-CTERM protein [Caldimonas sp.]
MSSIAATFTKPMRAALFALASIGACGLANARPASGPPTTTIEACSWDRPGHNPFIGDVVAAVDRYRDIPPDVRARLQARMAKRDYDDIVSIRRDSITGKGTYANTISDMHFGTQQVCRSVSRAAWTAAMQERGLVYCESGHCLLVPTVCRNVSRISRAAVGNERVAGPDEAGPLAEATELQRAGPLGVGDGVPLALDSTPGYATSSPAGLFPAGTAFAPAGFGGSGESPASSPAETILVHAASTVPKLESDAPPPVALAPVPEPETWALMLAGLLALAAAQRRRRGSAVRAISDR